LVSTLIVLPCPRALLHAQEVYKSVDAQGHVVYSDRGITKTAAKTPVHVDEPDPAEVARLAREQELLKAEEIQRKKEQTLEAKNKAISDHNKQAACQSARNNYFRLRDTPRLYQRDAEGNRVYYSDADADTLRAQAKRSMTAACGT
jgi:uncharacterized membrane protein YqiK